MPFETDGNVYETTDASTTSFTTSGSDKVYEEEGATSIGASNADNADDVNPRRLLHSPSVDDIRWLARTSLGGTLVNKPVDDAFKNGFEITNDRENANVQNVLEEDGWEYNYKLAQKKARRDGFALMFMVLEDDSDGVHVDPTRDDVDVEGVKKLQFITLDDLVKYSSVSSIPSGNLADAIPYEEDRYEIRRTGLVVDMDPTSGRYKEPLGYIVGRDAAKKPDKVDFIHHKRVFHYTWNKQVDGDLDDETLGEYEGDSVLMSSYHLLRGLKKGNWSLMETLFRYAAKMYHITLPEDADEDDWDEANDQLQNLNAKSEIVTPSGYEMEDYGTEGQLQPEEYFNIIFEQICATNEMTKSVLFGTQSGTVSGSETDIKNYFNKVQRLRKGEFENDMRKYVTRRREIMDNRTSDEYTAEFDVDWGPLFKLSKLDQAEVLTRKMQTLAAGINNFVLTPDEARSVLAEEWADVDIEWNQSLSDEDVEYLESINVHQQGSETAEDKGSTQQQNGGGMQKGQQTASEEPTSDSREDAVTVEV